MNWEKFQTSLEALYLGSSFKSAVDVTASANLLVDKIREAQARVTTLLPTSRLVAVTCPRTSKGGYGTNAGKLWTHCPKLKKELNDLSRKISEAITKAAAPKCPITDRSGVRRYDAKARVEVIAEYLSEQFIPNPPATSPPLQEHYAQVTYRSRVEGGKSSRFRKRERTHKNLLKNIWSITLLSHVAIFERALLTKLCLFLTLRQVQYGFRSSHSTTLQLTRVLHRLAYERNCERYTVAVLLDMQKAFDRVWRYGLIYKLLDSSLPPALTRVVASFLQRRSVCVTINDMLSAPRPIRVGVPQGSCLSPELYTLYTDDILTLCDHLEDWEHDVMLSLYVDDSAYFASSRRADLSAKRIQGLFDLLPEWLLNGG
ncbi:RNA-directed DNA polymerase from mobile element jockey [Eumeta japonica]|uniref:RNA-directed DNA polymerase from mobile element jockey n=1 Tax=Eumeta variegata TaxID=151549 RepID=A0A4C1VF59_EUMVA|nr:RNA-directed DNA polymerase from mobile element jockey [Eumeta japonica]